MFGEIPECPPPKNNLYVQTAYYDLYLHCCKNNGSVVLCVVTKRSVTVIAVIKMWICINVWTFYTVPYPPLFLFQIYKIYMYVNAFGRCFGKRFTVHSSYTFYQHVCFLRSNP